MKLKKKMCDRVDMAPLSLVAVLLSSVWTEVYVKLKKKMCDKVDNKPFLTSTVAIASRRRDYLKTNCSCMEGSYSKIGDWKVYRLLLRMYQCDC